MPNFFNQMANGAYSSNAGPQPPGSPGILQPSLTTQSYTPMPPGSDPMQPPGMPGRMPNTFDEMYRRTQGIGVPGPDPMQPPGMPGQVGRGQVGKPGQPPGQNGGRMGMGQPGKPGQPPGPMYGGPQKPQDVAMGMGRGQIGKPGQPPSQQMSQGVPQWSSPGIGNYRSMPGGRGQLY